jgi:hypothetical protein
MLAMSDSSARGDLIIVPGPVDELRQIDGLRQLSAR